MFDVSVIVTAAGKNSRMRQDMLDAGCSLKNKLALSLGDSCVVAETLDHVFKLNVDEIILILGHYKYEILEAINDINDSRLKIIENQNHDVDLSQSLLNGLQNTQSKTVLCTTGDQPTITTKTYKKILNHQLKNPTKNITVLRRKKIGKLDTALGLGMPFATNRTELIKYLKKENSNLNPILRKMHKDNYTFYGIKEENPLELININHLKDYQYVLKNYKGNII